MKKQGDDFLGGEGFGDMDFGLDEEQAQPVAEKKTEEMSEVLKQFLARGKEERKTFEENVDSEYWVAVCFQSREQKEEFLRLAGWLQFGDKYLDGLEIAEHMKIKIGHLTPPVRKVVKAKDWNEFV